MYKNNADSLHNECHNKMKPSKTKLRERTSRRIFLVFLNLMLIGFYKLEQTCVLNNVKF